MTRSSLLVAERKYLGGAALDIKRLEQHSLGIVQRGLMRDLGDNRRKQVWAAVLILESGAGRVLRTQASASEELSSDQDRSRQLSLSRYTQRIG